MTKEVGLVRAMELKDYIDRLNEILVKKQTILHEISGFTRMQREALQGEKYNELEILIARKQERIEAVNKLDEQFAVYSSRLKDIAGITSFDELPRLNIPGTRELKANVSAIFDLLNEIKSIEEENTGKLTDEMSKLKDKIKQSNSFKKVNKAYSPPGTGMTNHYFDKKK